MIPLVLLDQWCQHDPQMRSESKSGKLVRPGFGCRLLIVAVASGAKTMCETSDFSKLGKNFIEPQVLIDVDHTMSIMMEETFGPVVGVMKVGHLR